MPVFPHGQVAGFRLRPQRDATDMAFLATLMSTAREKERNAFQGDESLWRMLMEHQARAQTAHYRSHYPAATLDILEKDGAGAGRLCLCEMDDEIRLMDIVIIPVLRNQGHGRAIVEAVMSEAAARGLAVRLHVEHFNPARRLYDRLGFKLVEDRGVHQFMEWRPLLH